MKNIKKLLICSGILASALSTAVFAAPEKDKKAEKPAAVETQKNEALKVERNGTTVTLAWTLPAGDWVSLDILRNDKAATKGRGKVKTLRAKVNSYVDTLPEAGDKYWYWLKLVDKDKKLVNIGPVQAK